MKANASESPRSQSFSSPFLRAATSHYALLAAWRIVARNRGCAGTDRVSIPAYAADLDANLTRLKRELASGHYRPRPLLECEIPKPCGGKRRLLIPAVRDRVLQTAIKSRLTPAVERELEDCSFAYRPGLGVDAAVDRIRSHYRDGYRWVVEADIKRFFGTVNHERALACLTEIVDDEALSTLVFDWIAGRVRGTAYDYRMTQGLPQGSPLSPLMANLYLDAFDEALLARGYRLVRYADDFVILSRSVATAQRIVTDVREELARVGLSLHGTKTKVSSFRQGFRFLGHTFVRSMVVRGW